MDFKMWRTLTFAVGLILVCSQGVHGEGIMGRLNWCKTLCMCRDATHVEVKCFGRSDIYQLLDFRQIQMIKLERANWQLENQVEWCNDTCLCHQNNNQKIFKCVEEDILKQFILDNIGDEYFYVEEESDVEELPQDVAAEDTREMEHRRRQEERRRNRGRNRKQRKRIKSKQESTTTSTTTSTTVATTSTMTLPTTTEIVEIWPTIPAEVDTTTTQAEAEVDHHRGWFWHSPSSAPFGHNSDLTTPSTTRENINDVDGRIVETDNLPYAAPEPTEDLAAQNQLEEDEIHEMNDYVIEDYPIDTELLPKQEAVAASPAVTALQPPTRRLPPTTSSQTAMRDMETVGPKVSAVLEVPVQRKTVASEVSQDLDELGNTVMEIQNDVVLNQRILLVTVVVAGIAMLGVIVLTIHNCIASKRQAAAEERRGAKDSPKEDNHVTKVNLEEAW